MTVWVISISLSRSCCWKTLFLPSRSDHIVTTWWQHHWDCVISTLAAVDSQSKPSVLQAKMGQDQRPSLEGESETARLERLGRERPAKLGSKWKEIGFVFSIVFSQCLNEYFISGVTVLVPQLAEPLGIPAARITWPVAAFSLVISGFLFPAGRLADIYGGKWIYTIGVGWTCVWALVIGFAQNEIMLDVCRAVQGLGPAMYLPSGLQLLGSTYRPGPRKNIAFSIYGSMAALGFFVGVFFAGRLSL